jgi:cytochrome d ubiquinol oxidase subunit II
MNIFDYHTLQYIWWGVMLVLLIGFSITDGFDMGVATLLPFIAKNDIERRVVINTVGATWEGNQVWLITAGAALFAAFPQVYATAFSSLYIALMLTLFCLFLRPVGFDYRSKLPNPKWRKYWDIALFIGGFAPSLVFGLTIGNIFLGLPFYFDKWQMPFNTTSFFQLFHPFALLSAFIGVSLLTLHGATWLNLKTSGIIQQRARKFAKALAIIFSILWICGGFSLNLIQGFNLNAQSIVTVGQGLWLERFMQTPSLYLICGLGIICVILNIILQAKHAKLAWFFSALTIVIFFINTSFALFPFLLPSTTNIQQSLTAFNASSSHKTLFCMLIAVVIFMPLIIAYTSWVYRVLKGKVKAEDIENGQKNTNTHWY